MLHALSALQLRGHLDPFKPMTHSFIIRLWLEETAEQAGRAAWRGNVTHVPGGERRYLKKLEEIDLFIAPYLEEMGIRLGACWRLRQWLDRCRRRLNRPTERDANHG